ncbi:helix-turn-helix domain protein [Methylobacterium sp. 4-46]|uniref:helix-turn-helix transcriptional regulator n=1 Tax=unclassified Methylobacterium TaxID=2615210 RepID=UPI000165C6F1|nr:MULTISPECIES: helix-turn-helix transcriptional regulator [Methylobacterium]ACA16820.1 helix-turn-helix domain protein [Methylobacterium sp. 4-46]WFT82514.1 helix-turn-helix transcriptional regulator [Methylobacterium nodulans]
MLGPDERRDLGAFLRAHRERLRPEAPTGRRRTPGLRREELAARAGISATWCAWIEQGREVQVSAQALGRLASALGLTRAERAYLFDLAGRKDPRAAPPDPGADAPASLRAAVAAFASPAYGLDRLWTLCCWNEAARRLFGGWLETAAGPNLLRFVLLDPAARRLIPDWDERVRRVIAEFRADFGHGRADPRARALVAALRRESPLFAVIWEEQDVRDRTGGLRRFLHPEDGPVTFLQHSFSPADRPDCKLVLLVPCG